jgi:hypothetical protein
VIVDVDEIDNSDESDDDFEAGTGRKVGASRSKRDRAIIDTKEVKALETELIDRSKIWAEDANSTGENIRYWDILKGSNARDLAVEAPTTVERFQEVSTMGVTKNKRWGKKIVEVIVKFLKSVGKLDEVREKEKKLAAQAARAKKAKPVDLTTPSPAPSFASQDLTQTGLLGAAGKPDLSAFGYNAPGPAPNIFDNGEDDMDWDAAFQEADQVVNMGSPAAAAAAAAAGPSASNHFRTASGSPAINRGGPVNPYKR